MCHWHVTFVTFVTPVTYPVIRILQNIQMARLHFGKVSCFNPFVITFGYVIHDSYCIDFRKKISLLESVLWQHNLLCDVVATNGVPHVTHHITLCHEVIQHRHKKHQPGWWWGGPCVTSGAGYNDVRSCPGSLDRAISWLWPGTSGARVEPE